MKRTGVIFALVLAVGMGVGWFGHQHLSAQQAPVKVLAFYVADKGQPLTTAVPD